MKQRLRLLLTLFVGSTLLMGLQKPLFMLLHGGISPTELTISDFWQVFLHGLSLDMTVAGYITALPLLILLLSLWIPLSARIWRGALTLFLGAVALLAAAIYAVDLGLYPYWGFRIDSSILIYLATPREATASLTLGDWCFGLGAFTGLLLLFGGLFWLVLRGFSLSEVKGWRRMGGTLLLLLCSGLCFLAIRGGLTVAVANVSKVYFSQNQFLNHAATNPLFSLLSTLGDDKDFEPQYLFFEEAEREARFEALRGDRKDSPVSPRVLTSERPDVVLIIMESCGRTFMEATSQGEAVMPYLQRIKEQGIWFENCFANSFRTDRGEVAVMNGYPAQTRMSIMKHPAKSRNLPAIARSLAREGYATWFTYGGDLNFTDQSSYMYATGWQELTYQKDLRFDAPTSKWGYADDVMADYFSGEVLRRTAAPLTERAPQLLGWLTLSSHEPFEVPYAKFEDRILNAVAFTDEMVGRMVEAWAETPAWENMLVILIPDHGYPWPDTLAYNAPLRHRIPMIWTGGAVREPQVAEAYCSQMDLAATLLSQLGVDHSDFIFSKDIFSPHTPKFGYWTFNDGFGVATAEGESLYDCTSGRRLLESDSLSPRIDWGKVLLQTTYWDIRENL